MNRLTALSKTVLNTYIGGFLCERTTGDWFVQCYYGLRTHILARSNDLKLNCLNDGFVSCINTPLFTSQDINWWTGVVWIIVMFLSAVWSLILTAPVHCRWSTGEQVMQCYISPNLFWGRNQLIYILDDLSVSIVFSNLVFIFVWTIPLRPGMCIRQIKTSSKYCSWGIVLKMTCMKKHTSSKCLADVCLLSAPLIWVTLISFMWFSSSNAGSNWSRCFIYLFSWNHFLKHTAESLSISSASNFRNGLHTLVFAASWNSHTWLMKWTQTKWLYSESFNAKHISWISKINTK